MVWWSRFFNSLWNLGPRFNHNISNMCSMSEMSKLNRRLDTAQRLATNLLDEIEAIRGIVGTIQNGTLLEKTGNIRQYSSSSRCNEGVDGGDVHQVKRRKTENTEFNYEGEHVVVYTDGACENNGKVGARAGLGVWFGPNHPLNISAPVSGKPTNNSGEIQACIQALQIAQTNGLKKVCIKTDSQFVINSMTQWIKRWKKNNWKLASGGDVKNKRDFSTLDECVAKMDDVRWEYVAGHRGIVGNEAADKLAREGALLYSAKQ